MTAEFSLTEITFEPFAKIARLNRDITITEKIDGTNGQIIITDDGRIGAASRNQLISVAQDHMGFAAWVQENKSELLKLGAGHHYGEWWGAGVGRRAYGQKGKTFSLFNTKRWAADTQRPACCSVVPILYQGPFSEQRIQETVEMLRSSGSVAAPGFMKPEGIVIWHDHARLYFKVTLENDEMSKGEAEARSKTEITR